MPALRPIDARLSNKVVFAGNVIHARQAKFVAVSIMQPIPPLDELEAGLQVVITVVASA